MSTPRFPSRSILCALALALAPAAPAGLVPYASTPGAKTSENFRLTVDGQPVLVERFGDVSYARFSFSGTVDLVVETGRPVTTHSISPKADKITGRVEGTRLAFSLSKPRGLVVKVDQAEKLLILADPVETDAPAPGQPGVRNLADYLEAGRDPAVPVTAAFQKALDETAAPQDGAGGTLFVPNGLYVTAQLKLRSNVRLHLESGALVQAVADVSAEAFPPQAWKVDSSFLFASKAQNVKITGRGILDGNGREIRQLNPEAKFKLLRTAECSRVMIDGVMLRDSARWTAHFLASDDIVVRNLKILNDLQGPSKGGDKLEPFVSNTDGIDIDACHKVLVEDSFIYTTDDAFSTKVTGYLKLKKPCTDIVLRNNVLWSLKCALRVGDETLDDLSQIVFENNETIRADRLLAIWCGDACRISDVRILDNRAEYIGGDANERIFYFRIRLKSPRSKPGLIDNVVIKDLVVDQPARQASTLEGFDEAHPISNVLFDNVVVGGKPVRNAGDLPLKFTNPFHRDVKFAAPQPSPAQTD
jgi:hypothetical protein